MRNEYTLSTAAGQGEAPYITIKVWDKAAGVARDCQIDECDLARVASVPGSWHAVGKSLRVLRVEAKVWDAAAQTTRTVMMHRLVLSAMEGQEVIHHDGDGLNNRRYNIAPRPMAVLDERLTAARAERKVATAVAREHGISRQAMYKIRTGRTKSGAACTMYRALRAAHAG